uniref:Uncharacterized protein n=1 Tax=Chelonoidis abingdonii TaxID=106734 RepID=A0A8C0QLW2_CHEAB
MSNTSRRRTLLAPPQPFVLVPHEHGHPPPRQPLSSRWSHPAGLLCRGRAMGAKCPGNWSGPCILASSPLPPGLSASPPLPPGRRPVAHSSRGRRPAAASPTLPVLSASHPLPQSPGAISQSPTSPGPSASCSVPPGCRPAAPSPTSPRLSASGPLPHSPGAMGHPPLTLDHRPVSPSPQAIDQLPPRPGGHVLDLLVSLGWTGADPSCPALSPLQIFTRLGKCYTFNAGAPGNELLTTVKGGSGNGLELMLNIQQEEYLPVWGENEISYEAGVKVQIHSQDEPPYIHQLGFGVSPGFQTFVSCQQQRLVYLPPPWGDCKSTPIESDFFTSYSITACRLDCETRYLAENCNCRMVHMPGEGEFCVCRTPCDMVRYGKELSMVKIPSKASAKYLAKKYNKSEQDNVLVLDVFFEALNYETIEQKKAYEVAGLLGDIGGQMGLFIGASILTILEIFDYLYEVRPLALGASPSLRLVQLRPRAPSQGRAREGALSFLHPPRTTRPGEGPQSFPRPPRTAHPSTLQC